MTMKIAVLLGIVIVLLAILIAMTPQVPQGKGPSIVGQNQSLVQPPEDNASIVGNDRDEHGCIPSAGYVWCESKQKCIRPWEESCGPEACLNMTYEEARAIAENSECVENASLGVDHWCNNVTRTFWIDLNIEKKGCNPACVVYIDNKTAEINWMCTGLLM